jgi:hypothetical protein
VPRTPPRAESSDPTKLAPRRHAAFATRVRAQWRVLACHVRQRWFGGRKGAYPSPGTHHVGVVARRVEALACVVAGGSVCSPCETTSVHEMSEQLAVLFMPSLLACTTTDAAVLWALSAQLVCASMVRTHT